MASAIDGAMDASCPAGQGLLFMNHFRLVNDGLLSAARHNPSRAQHPSQAPQRHHPAHPPQRHKAITMQVRLAGDRSGWLDVQLDERRLGALAPSPRKPRAHKRAAVHEEGVQQRDRPRRRQQVQVGRHHQRVVRQIKHRQCGQQRRDGRHRVGGVHCLAEASRHKQGTENRQCPSERGNKVWPAHPSEHCKTQIERIEAPQLKSMQRAQCRVYPSSRPGRPNTCSPVYLVFPRVGRFRTVVLCRSAPRCVCTRSRPAQAATTAVGLRAARREQRKGGDPPEAEVETAVRRQLQ
mmetsp:Transcript_19376/g.50345  ORF Transcript_19376/g.50345 Transcript_19376/m.50345 type:complete len:294 (+) Transcript_19376:57-938(+)